MRGGGSPLTDVSCDFDHRQMKLVPLPQSLLPGSSSPLNIYDFLHLCNQKIKRRPRILLKENSKSSFLFDSFLHPMDACVVPLDPRASWVLCLCVCVNRSHVDMDAHGCRYVHVCVGVYMCMYICVQI